MRFFRKPLNRIRWFDHDHDMGEQLRIDLFVTVCLQVVQRVRGLLNRSGEKGKMTRPFVTEQYCAFPSIQIGESLVDHPIHLAHILLVVSLAIEQDLSALINRNFGDDDSDISSLSMGEVYDDQVFGESGFADHETKRIGKMRKFHPFRNLDRLVGPRSSKVGFLLKLKYVHGPPFRDPLYHVGSFLSINASI